MSYWLEDAVLAVCASPECLVPATASHLPEGHLWFELAACILGSQVPHWMGVAAARRLRESRLLQPPSSGFVEEDIVFALRTPLASPNGFRLYRFPNIRAKQIVAASRNVIAAYGSLDTLVYGASPEEARTRLVKSIPGMGLKQASLFLRNAGVSNDFAVLDVHVIRYMSMIGLLKTRPESIGLDMYYTLESVLTHYASRIGFSVGHVDRAIWAVMSSSHTSIE